MKKFGIIILFAIVTVTLAFAGDIIKVLTVYTNGVCTTIPLISIDSLDHSDYSSSVIHSIDQDYQIPISSIDSIIVGEIDVEHYDEQINEINDFINEQTELEVNAFQDNLLTWLNANENIQEASINEDKNFVSIKFKNGMDFFICFQDMSFYEDDSTADTNFNKRKSSTTSGKRYYNVSFQNDEKIIESPQILYIKGMDMDLSYLVYKWERDGIDNQIKNSPVNCKIKEISEELTFIEENFANYGVVIISQTHGGGGGTFMVSRPIAADSGIVDPQEYSRISKAFIIFTEYKDDISEESLKSVIPFRSIPVYLIRPSLIKKKLSGNNKTIVYGNYCWSFGLADYIKDNTVVGFNTKVRYLSNWAYTVDYLLFLLNGFLSEDFINNEIPYDYDEAEGGKVFPSTNHLDSKQRYFSIKTDDITKYDERGYPIVTGKINGYKNLKKNELEHALRLYVNEGEGTFTPENDAVIILSDGITVEDDGSMTCNITEELKVGETYSFIIGFEYGNNVYYGEVKTGKVESTGLKLCPDNNHPHAIDLGLPSGTKWCCCNVGASTPEGYGGYYAWGETTTKSVYNWDTYAYGSSWDNCQYIGSDIAGTGYDAATANMGAPWRMPSHEQQQELINNCSRQWTQVNGKNGILVTGRNGGQIFLPAAGCRCYDGLSRAGGNGLYLSSSLYPNDDYLAYGMNFYSGYWYWDSSVYYRYDGFSVRAVCP